MSQASITHGDGRPTRSEVAQLRREVEGEMWEIEHQLAAREEGLPMTPAAVRGLLGRRRELQAAYRAVMSM